MKELQSSFMTFPQILRVQKDHHNYIQIIRHHIPEDASLPNLGNFKKKKKSLFTKESTQYLDSWNLPHWHFLLKQ
jgi:hypothetical protein